MHEDKLVCSQNPSYSVLGGKGGGGYCLFSNHVIHSILYVINNISCELSTVTTNAIQVINVFVKGIWKIKLVTNVVKLPEWKKHQKSLPTVYLQAILFGQLHASQAKRLFH